MAVNCSRIAVAAFMRISWNTVGPIIERVEKDLDINPNARFDNLVRIGVDEYIASEKEDLESYNADLEEALEELKDMRADWKPEKEPNMDEEIELIKKWVKEREDFINE